MSEWTSCAVLWRLLHLLVWPLELHMHSAYTGALFSQWEGCVPWWEGIINTHVLIIPFRLGTHPSLFKKQKWKNEHQALFWGGFLRLLHLFVRLYVVIWYTSVFCSPETVFICDGKQVFLSIYPMLMTNQTDIQSAPMVMWSTKWYISTTNQMPFFHSMFKISSITIHFQMSIILVFPFLQRVIGNLRATKPHLHSASSRVNIYLHQPLPEPFCRHWLRSGAVLVRLLH